MNLPWASDRIAMRPSETEFPPAKTLFRFVSKVFGFTMIPRFEVFKELYSGLSGMIAPVAIMTASYLD